MINKDGKTLEQALQKGVDLENGKWAFNYKIDWKNYVDDGWDEGINCNGYADRETVDRLNDVIKKLEEKSGRHLACPAEKEKCAAVIKK